MNLSGLGYPDQPRTLVEWQWPKGIKQLDRPRWPQSERLYQLAQKVPTLDLNFAANRSLLDNISGRNLITFTRASTGTYVDRDGILKTAAVNEPRFDCNPVTGESLGLLVEEARTNLIIASQVFNSAPWGPGNITVAVTSDTASPDGSNNATKLTENTTASVFHYNNYAIAKAASAITYTYSIYLKAAGREIALSLSSGSNGATCRFNLATGSNVTGAGVYGTGFTAASAAIAAAGNGWYRCSLTCTTDTTVTLQTQFSFWNTSLATNVYTGDGASGVYAWGAQLEAVAAFPTSYIPTTSATVTRAADVASITGSNFSQWYQQDEGTMFVQMQVAGYDSTTNPGLVELRGANIVTDRITLFLAGAGPNYRCDITTSSVNQFLQNVASLLNILDLNSSAIAYRINDSVSYGRISNSTDTLVTLPIITSLNFGSSSSVLKRIRRITYFPNRLPSSTLQTITK